MNDKGNRINSSYDQRPPYTEKELTLIIKGFHLS